MTSPKLAQSAVELTAFLPALARAEGTMRPGNAGCAGGAVDSRSSIVRLSRCERRQSAICSVCACEGISALFNRVCRWVVDSRSSTARLSQCERRQSAICSVCVCVGGGTHQ